jgi:hypothetical protein
VRGAIVSVVLIACGCLAPPSAQRGQPLYPTTSATPHLPLDQVARLRLDLQGVVSPRMAVIAFIKSIDGRAVGTGDTAFELLPGCHVVEVEHRPYYRSSIPRSDFPGRDGTRVFPLQMKAGHEYVVVVRYEISSFAGASAHAVETDRSGAQVQMIAEASSPRDVQACNASPTPPG